MFSMGSDSVLSFLPAFFSHTSHNRSQLVWNETTTNDFVRQSVQNSMDSILPDSIASSALVQFLISFLFHFIFSNHIFSAGIALVIGGQLGEFIKARLLAIYDFIKGQFVYTLEIKEREGYRYNMVYTCLRDWLATVDHFKDAKHSTVSAKRRSDDSDDEDGEDGVSLQLVPGPGVHNFKYKGHSVSIERSDPSENADKKSASDCEKFTLSVTWWNGKKILSEIVENAMKTSLQSEKGVTSIYAIDEYCSGWDKLCERPNRSLDTIYLDETIKMDLLNDMDRFLTGGKFYKRNGLNYQRGYLLYGPPGTGKTSLILALAARMHCAVFIMNLSDHNLDDSKLQHLLTKLPRKGIILLEDIDSAFNEKRKKEESSGKVTFSGLLNALDGVACQTTNFPRIFFMSTNHVERLDPALIRPGRIDHKIQFDYATRDQICQMVKNFYEDYNDLGNFANCVADKFPENKLTTAEIQCYLMRYIYNPEECLKHVGEYIEQVEKLKLKQKQEEEQAEKEVEKDAEKSE